MASSPHSKPAPNHCLCRQIKNSASKVSCFLPAECPSAPSAKVQPKHGFFGRVSWPCSSKLDCHLSSRSGFIASLKASTEPLSLSPSEKPSTKSDCFFPAECPPPPRAKVQPKRGFVRPTQSHIGQCPSMLVTTGSSPLVFSLLGVEALLSAKLVALDHMSCSVHGVLGTSSHENLQLEPQLMPQKLAELVPRKPTAVALAFSPAQARSRVILDVSIYCSSQGHKN